MIVWEISFGNLIQMGLIIVGGLSVFFALRGNVDGIGKDVKRLERRAGLMEDSVEQVKKVLIQVAVQDERMNNQDARFQRLEKEMDDLRAGEGFKLPFPAGGRGPK